MNNSNNMASSNNSEFKVGIAGFAGIGLLHAQTFDSLVEVGKIQVADPNRINENGFLSLSKKDEFFDDYKNLKECDIVVIALPTELHTEAVSFFSSKKTAMLIEKPLDLHMSSLKELLKQLNKNKFMLCVV